MVLNQCLSNGRRSDFGSLSASESASNQQDSSRFQVDFALEETSEVLFVSQKLGIVSSWEKRGFTIFSYRTTDFGELSRAARRLLKRFGALDCYPARAKGALKRCQKL